MIALYLAIALTYSFLTPALETNDEPSHLAYVEYIVANHRVPSIPAIDKAGTIEWQQPPAYYLLVAAWQSVLLIPSFSLNLTSNPFTNGITPTLVFQHSYSALQHENAIRLHLLRLVSVGCGLVVLISALATTWLLTRRRGLAIAVGLTVSLWPKLLVLDSSLTNDALANATCAAALLAVVVWVKRPQTRWVVAFGIVAAIGALTKYTTLPILILLCVGLIVAAIRRRLWVSAVLAPVIPILATAWWWILDTVKYGDPLASGATKHYLELAAPWLIRHPGGTYNPSLISMISRQLSGSVFYEGGQDQIAFPHNWALALDGVGLICLVLAVTRRKDYNWPVIVSVLGACLAWLFIAHETTLAEGRYLLVAAVPLAFLFVLGTSRFGRLAIWVWPGLMAAANVWVFAAYLVPYGRL